MRAVGVNVDVRAVLKQLGKTEVIGDRLDAGMGIGLLNHPVGVSPAVLGMQVVFGVVLIGKDVVQHISIRIQVHQIVDAFVDAGIEVVAPGDPAEGEGIVFAGDQCLTVRVIEDVGKPAHPHTQLSEIVAPPLVVGVRVPRGRVQLIEIVSHSLLGARSGAEPFAAEVDRR